ncbi:MAG: hypothetical protein RBU25_03905 [Lentisphaeria bacterium]|jgi:hypothetical protein|nr:hypothetical protein [Lentisphaeria bacterium]
MEYFRIHATYCGRTGKPVGIFGACHHLKRAGRLTPEEAALFEEIDTWYTEVLPEPPFYKDGNPRKAIVWFKDTQEVRQLALRLDPLVGLLDKYGVANQVSRTTTPGTIIYEDQYQVAVI